MNIVGKPTIQINNVCIKYIFNIFSNICEFVCFDHGIAINITIMNTFKSHVII